MVSDHTQLTVSEKISLSLPYQQYAEALYDVIDRNRAYLSQYMSWPSAVLCPADTMSFLADSYLAYREDRGKTYIILYGGEPVGVLSFNEIDLLNKTATVGYWLDRDMQKKGIISCALKCLTERYAQSGMIRRFVIKCITTNQDSNAVAKRAGFQHEGVLKSAEYINGVYHDQNLYALISSPA
ncbi:50S ribosomal protein L7/L12-serine acetyltransferase [Enterobacillus tribolii]|uniref:[LSU ribosomal protein L12P]-serine N-acetyltransferase n=1 Tax=Enterobacillus tribolii TaxID=1487935 RepID=A0A370R2P1_9GAMM|nr:50S ribosomal protein L7/L12-serine acetyltransferase [Enterobacillus tribolii]MBW7984680.1 50S ribosomal protein L7/L12-serine acetyltransferase [Enterobacillus tribolii]RDK96678.1 [LSU ribosomal protein L12P]-serine N-acetyltransferase [Enterobacillus tribolii]